MLAWSAFAHLQLALIIKSILYSSLPVDALFSTFGILSFCEAFYSGCQKNVPVFKRFFLQPFMPHFRILEHYYGKRYKIVPV